MELSPITKFKIRDSSVVYYPSFEMYPIIRGYNDKSQENLLDNRVKGFLSPSSARRVRDMVLNWINISKAVSCQDSVPMDSLLTFITLTLPSVQVHSDLEIKRKCLNRFLIWLEAKKSVTAWLWKAEPQGNGNIHFHVLVNRFIPWKDIRAYWIKCLLPLGYVDSFEKKHGHRDPNCTDIHGLYQDKKGEKISYLGAYLAKYIAKKGDEELEHYRPLQGRVWGCSDNLKEIKAFVEISDSSNEFLYKSLTSSDRIARVNGDYFRLFQGDWKNLIKNEHDFLQKVHNFYYGQNEILLKKQDSDRQK